MVPTGAVMPPSPYGPYAFVFWNDELTEAGIRTQVAELAAAGFRGLTLSARIGLSREVGYLTADYLRLVRLCVEECAAHGLSVMLYDEASYPSGSANGAVVARDPAFAAQCLVRLSTDVTVAASGEVEFWRPDLGRAPDAVVLAVVATPVREGRAVLAEARTLELQPPGLVELDLAPGTWRVHAVVAGPSGGTIRGAHADQDDGSALAPPAADLLNPRAVATFLEVTHDAYAAALGDHVGSTVVAMFTDEPSLLGRGHRPGAVPYTPGLERLVAERTGADVADVLRGLPALWEDSEDPADGAPFRRQWEATVRARLHEVYYGAQSAWCAAHGIALTGHAAEGDDLGTTTLLDWPGQDTVWRWVLPGPTALLGPESTAAKVAGSAAATTGAPTAVAEVLGAYGWQLTMDEAKWLLDWYLARGVATLVLHAFFDSVRGNRAFESEPDLGRHHPWWPHLPAVVGYLARMADLLTAAPAQAPVAVLADDVHAPDAVAATLLQRQIDLHYVTVGQLATARRQGATEQGRLILGGQRYAVVVDARPGPAGQNMPELDVPVVSAGERDWADRVAGLLEEAGAALLRTAEPQPDLRVAQAAGGWLLVNEGEQEFRTTVALPDGVGPGWSWWFPFEDARVPVTGDGAAPLLLQRRQSVWLGPDSDAVELDRWPGEAGAGRTLEVRGWRGTPSQAPHGHGLPGVDGLPEGVDWCTRAGMRRFVGTVDYTTEIDLGEAAGSAVLDLGEVGEVAAVSVNGTPVATLGWAPYRCTVPAGLLRAGSNQLTVRVSNAADVYYRGAHLRSGLLGPVRLHCP
ncbi:hypothetical protein LQF12_00340 [Ruania suaedae]|uniref:hypothetical protein n=1 Tax=Ruania suaedae TaxID=2897774 RepID=UPI001E5DCE6D|nr:hypothetical protein [Ruania suaedae]UFU03097.1 hypothetical protein LQF12_00340 [Ruania suaedae]